MQASSSPSVQLHSQGKRMWGWGKTSDTYIESFKMFIRWNCFYQQRFWYQACTSDLAGFGQILVMPA